jgi:galactokinase
MCQSHQSLQHDYAVTGFELDTLVELAMSHKACIGARMTGAGFGGCAIALVQQTQIQAFSTYISQRYTEKCRLPLDIYVAEIENGVDQVS